MHPYFIRLVILKSSSAITYSLCKRISFHNEICCEYKMIFTFGTPFFLCRTSLLWDLIYNLIIANSFDQRKIDYNSYAKGDQSYSDMKLLWSWNDTTVVSNLLHVSSLFVVHILGSTAVFIDWNRNSFLEFWPVIGCLSSGMD